MLNKGVFVMSEKTIAIINENTEQTQVIEMNLNNFSSLNFIRNYPLKSINIITPNPAPNKEFVSM